MIAPAIPVKEAPWISESPALLRRTGAGAELHPRLRNLFVTQPTISKMIRNMEEELGQPC